MAPRLSRNDQPLRPLKWYRALRTPAAQREEKLFLVEGIRAISQIYRNSPKDIDEVLVSDSATLTSHFDVPTRTIPSKAFTSLCPSKNPSGSLAVIRMPKDCHSDRLPQEPGNKVLLLEHVQDPGNVGTLIRSAAAFGFEGAILSSECADPFSPKAVAASAGTILSVWIRRTPGYFTLLEALLERNFHLAATDIRGTQRPETISPHPRKLVLALGNEGVGLSEEILNRSTTIIRLPIDSEKAESINVAMTGAICMYALA